MALVEGLDYQLANVDYDERENNLLRDTYDTNVRFSNDSKYLPLWIFLDHSFDQAARDPILLDVEFHFIAVEDFCVFLSIPENNIPALYTSMFEAKAGFLTQAKMPYLMSDNWIKRFPEKIKPPEYVNNIPIILQDFKDFLSSPNTPEQKNRMYGATLAHLKRYLNYHNMDDEDTDSE